MKTAAAYAANGFAKAYATNATDSSFASVADTTTEPTGDGVISLASGDRVGAWTASIIFFGTGDANDVLLAKVYGVRRIGAASWTYIPLLSLTVTLGAKTGVAGGAVVATELYADTIVVASPSYGVADSSYRIVSPADDTVARVMLDTEGYEKLVIKFDDSTGNPTSMNALVAVS